MISADIITWKLEYVNERPVSLLAKAQKNPCGNYHRILECVRQNLVLPGVLRPGVDSAEAENLTLEPDQDNTCEGRHKLKLGALLLQGCVFILGKHNFIGDQK